MGQGDQVSRRQDRIAHLSCTTTECNTRGISHVIARRRSRRGNLVVLRRRSQGRRDCFAALAMTKIPVIARRRSRRGNLVVLRRRSQGQRDCFAALAMTKILRGERAPGDRCGYCFRRAWRRQKPRHSSGSARVSNMPTAGNLLLARLSSRRACKSPTGAGFQSVSDFSGAE